MKKSSVICSSLDPFITRITKAQIMAQRQLLETEQKALEINLDPRVYGTFAEIGAGQEVARHFFQVGAAAGTIAKTLSAYDKV